MTLHIRKPLGGVTDSICSAPRSDPLATIHVEDLLTLHALIQERHDNPQLEKLCKTCIGTYLAMCSPEKVDMEERL